jgi:glycosyltransferase involved in cell wall biosynthesis
MAREKKLSQMPRRFLYVGRYLPIKGPQDLWQAFAELKAETGTDWELWCVGQGDLPAPQLPGITHFGFVQPRDLSSFMGDCAVCVIPSHKDAWGVALQEMCAAGMPVVVSNSVGAAVTYYEKGKNGFMFHAGNVKELKKYLKKCTELSQAELLQMGEHSHRLSAACTPEKWADKLLQLVYVRN